MKRAVDYLRKSTDKQTELTIESQHFRCTNYINQHGWTFVRSYLDDSISGTRTNRKGFNEILSDAKRGLFDVVVFDALTRASRFDEVVYYYNWKKELNDCGVEVYSATEDINNEEIGGLIEFLGLWVANREIKNTTKNIWRTLHMNATKCQFNGGYVPLGFSISDDKKYIVNEEEAKIVQTIFDLFVNSKKGYCEIANYLNSCGFKTRRREPFGKNSIREILRNKKYAGYYVYNKAPKRVNGKRNFHAQKALEEVIEFEDAIPKIIEKDLFNMAQSIIDKRKQGESSRSKTDVFLLSGITRCGICGSALTGRTARKGENVYYYYECTGKRNAKNGCSFLSVNCADVDKVVLDYLRKLGRPETAKEIVTWFNDQMEQFIKNEKVPTIDLNKQLAKLQKDSAILVEKMIDFDSPSLRKRITEIDSQIAEIKKDISKSENTMQNLELLREDVVASFLSDITHFDEMTREQQKHLVRRYIRCVKLNQNGKKEKTAEIDSLIPSLFGCTKAGAEGGT